MDCFFSAKFDECPNRGRKVASPEGAVTHSSLVDWTDCSMKCSISLTCTFWQWEVSSGTCTTVTGTGDGSLTVDDGFVVGKRGCYSYLESSGWKTCTDTQLTGTMTVRYKYNSIGNPTVKRVRFFKITLINKLGGVIS